MEFKELTIEELLQTIGGYFPLLKSV
ncbi:bacteriocin [Streptococcus gordonii]|nr:bacteriocin [Streptococcus gordonii]